MNIYIYIFKPFCDIYDADIAESVSGIAPGMAVPGLLVSWSQSDSGPVIINLCTLCRSPAVTKITIMTAAKRFSGAPAKSSRPGSREPACLVHKMFNMIKPTSRPGLLQCETKNKDDKE